MDFCTEAGEPPRTENLDGDPRRVGVEIEFAAISAKGGANIVREMFGGHVEEEDPHRFHVRDTSMGDFVCELDTQFAHKTDDDGNASHTFEDSDLLARFQSDLRGLIGDISATLVPCEIVCPPVPYGKLPELDDLVAALIRAGAEGTRSNPLYAFGAQLNPEISGRDADYLTATLKAYLLLSPWLRAVMDVDLTRRLFAFADPFPKPYLSRVLAADYWPTRSALIEDYLNDNPTRNRELDLLPLFSWFDDDLVRQHVDDPRIKARPTFHYRLPDANIGEKGWSIVLEWNRWLVVERLAENRELLERMSDAFIDSLKNGHQRNWPMRCSEFLILS